MPDGSDTLARNVSEKENAISLLEAWQWYLRAKNEAPELFASFEKLLEVQGVNTRSLDDLGFQNALRQFARNFSRALTQKKELGATGSPDLQPNLVPLEILARAGGIVSDKKAFAALYKERFIGRLVKNFITQLKNQNLIENEDAESELTNRLVLRLSDLSEEQEAAFDSEALRAMQEEVQNPQMAAAAQHMFTQKTVLDEIHAYHGREAAFQRVGEAVIDAPVDHPALYAALLLYRAIDQPLEPMEEAKKTVARQVRLVEALAATSIEGPTTTPEASAAAGRFFQSFADTGTGAQRALAPAIDALVSVFGSKTQFALAEIITGKAFKKTLDQAQKAGDFGGIPAAGLIDLQKKIGDYVHRLEHTYAKNWSVRAGLFVSSHLFAQPNAIFEEILGIQSLRNSQAGLFQSLMTHVAGLPSLDKGATVRQVQTHGLLLLEYFWLTSGRAVFAIIACGSPHEAHVEFGSGGGWIIRWGASRAAGAARGAVGRWALKTAVGKIIGGFLVALTGPVGWGVAVGAVLGGVAGWLFGKIKGFLGGITNPLQLGGAGGQRRRGGPEGFWFVFSLVVLPLVLVVLLSFQSMSMMGNMFSITSEPPVGGSQQSPALTYDGQTPPVSAITTAPASGRLTQTPFQPGTTHEKVDAVDIKKNAGDPIVAAQDGFIVSNGTESGCLWDNDLGTYVRIVGSCGGQQCFTTYAHLSSCSSAVTGAVAGDTKHVLAATFMKAGTEIGRAGSTGNSTGAHLHFQYNGPGKLTDFFPSISNNSL